MSHRFLVSLGAAAVLVAAPLVAQAPKAAAKPAAAKSSAIPRTPDGHPDLQGFWTNATITPMERPAQFKDKPTLTDAEAKAYEQKDSEDLNKQDGQSDGPLIAAAGSSGTGGYNVLFVDRGTTLARVDGQARTSLVVDPPDGRVPMLPRNGRGGGAFPAPPGGGRGGQYDNVKNRPLSERCIIGFGNTAGPPMMPVLYNNNYQIVQTPDAIVILTEMVHDARIVRMGGTHSPKDMGQWLGDSIGHWDGDTLVVETTNLHAGNRFRGGTENQKITERFKRVDAKTILYRVTVEDPGVYAKPWTMEFPFTPSIGPLYEYACHEGNYAMPDILGGARLMESEASKKK